MRIKWERSVENRRKASRECGHKYYLTCAKTVLLLLSLKNTQVVISWYFVKGWEWGLDGDEMRRGEGWECWRIKGKSFSFPIMNKKKGKNPRIGRVLTRFRLNVPFLISRLKKEQKSRTKDHRETLKPHDRRKKKEENPSPRSGLKTAQSHKSHPQTPPIPNALLKVGE